MKKEAPIAIGFIAGVLILFEYFFKTAVPAVSPIATKAQNWGSIISAFAMGLAAANLMIIHARSEERRGGQQCISRWAADH